MGRSLRTLNGPRAVLWAGLAMLALAGGLFWRYTAPVEVRLESSVGDLPFEVEVFPPVVYARPGEMVNVVYRIHNRQIIPLEAFGRVQIEPARAEEQIKVFITQCSGLNTFQQNIAADYQVYFRVQPAGLLGSSRLVLRHIFTRAAPPRE